ncbi:MAG: alpha/beta hydrolase [Chitinophagaceae bacterium]|nr:alpha/beta hydrolase [Chitinophagaceae bacterium]
MKKAAVVIFLFLVFGGMNCDESPQPSVKGYIKAGKWNVYYERIGKGNTLLLLHAGLQDHSMWAEQVKVLSLHYDVVTPDLPFHGKTTGNDTTLLAQEVVKILLDSLHIQKLSVAGLSMGASVAQDFMIAYPQRVEKVFLISPGLNGYDKKYGIDSLSMNWYHQFSKALDAKDTPRAALEFTRAWAEGIYRAGDSLQAPVSKYVYDKSLANLRLHKMEGWPLLQNNPPAIERVSNVKVPVLVIDGDKDLPYITQTARYLEKNIPGARRIVMQGVAHMLNMEKPEELNKILIDFLKNN